MKFNQILYTEEPYNKQELTLAALVAINNENGLTMSELISVLRRDLEPKSEEDLKSLQGRNDDLFSQKIRNLISHKNIQDYIFIDNNIMKINTYGKEYILKNRDKLREDDIYSLIDFSDDFIDENSDFDYKNKFVDLNNIYKSVSDLKRMYDRSKKENEGNVLILDPYFQRSSNVWSNKNKSLFIESIILNIPIPSVYLSENSKGNLLVIDGRQRLSTLFDFLDDKFALTGLVIMSELNKKKFSQFTGDLEKYKTSIEDRSLHVSKIRQGTPEPFIIETFSRVNTKGTRLNAQEIRNALHSGKSTKLLNDLSERYVGNNEIVDRKRMKDKYLILRYFSMQFFYDNLVKNNEIPFKSISDYLGNIMDRINDFNDDQINKLHDDFIEVYERALKIFNDRAFRLKEGTPINMILFECTLLLTSLFKDQDDKTIIDAYNSFINIETDEFKRNNDDYETPFEKNIRYHRDSKENIITRIRWIKEIKGRFI